ncbi:MAG: MFS transporter [Actinomycetota bacterium]
MNNDDHPTRERSIVALLVCVFCSAAAALVGVTALGVQVYDLTQRELDLGLLGLAEFTPSALLVLVTGSIADRLDRRRISSVSAAVGAAAAVGLALYAASDPTSVVPIFWLVLLFGAARAFLAPANRALPADIVPADDLPRLQAQRAASWQSAIIVGPVLAGFLYAIDPLWPFVAMAGLFGIAGGSMFLVHVPGRGRKTPTDGDILEPSIEPDASAPAARGRLPEALEGLRFIRRSPILFGAITLDLFAVLFGGAVALLPAIAEDRLGVDSVGLGWLRAAGGIGAAVVTLALARRPVAQHVGRTLLIVVAIFGAGTIGLGLTRSFVVAFIAMAVLSGADAVSVYIRSTLVPLATPPDKRGRVLAVESVFIGASNELGAFESGVAGQLLGASGAVVLGGAATLAIAGTYWVAFPALRDVDRFPEPTTDSEAPR